MFVLQGRRTRCQTPPPSQGAGLVFRPEIKGSFPQSGLSCVYGSGGRGLAQASRQHQSPEPAGQDVECRKNNFTGSQTNFSNNRAPSASFAPHSPRHSVRLRNLFFCTLHLGLLPPEGCFDVTPLAAGLQGAPTRKLAWHWLVCCCDFTSCRQFSTTPPFSRL